MTKFVKAKRSKTFLKIAVTGPSGSGKTYSSLRLARGFVGDQGRIAVIDTENGSASNYDSLTDFDTLNIEPPFEHTKYVDAINAAIAEKYDILIIDSASHLWKWILDYKNKLDKRGGNGFTNWHDAGQKLEAVIDVVLQSPIHIIFCMRSKTEYVIETGEKGKQTPVKVGLSPIMRDGIEYEFTTVFDIAIDHHATAGKDRTGLFVDKVEQITEGTGRRLREWHEASAEHKEKPKSTVPARDDDDDRVRDSHIAEIMRLTNRNEFEVVATVAKHFGVSSLDEVTTE